MTKKSVASDRYQAIIRLENASGADSLAKWLNDDVLVAIDDQHTWARFHARDERLMQQAKAMPAERFRVVDQRLVLEGHRIATADLPELDWQPIASVIQVQLPWIGQAGQVANLKSVTWQLSRGGAECPIAGAIIQWQALATWVETAAQWRLAPLRYCVSELDGNRCALVLGTPVPPTDALYVVARHNILVPAGMHWLPPLETECVQRSFGLQSDQWLLWRAINDWYVIDDDMFMPLSRGSVRLLSVDTADSGSKDE